MNGLAEMETWNTTSPTTMAPCQSKFIFLNEQPVYMQVAPQNVIC